MGIVRKPPAKPDGWEWVFIGWPRQLGEFRVSWTWIQRRVVQSGNDCTVTWRTADGLFLHSATETMSGW